MSEKWVDGSGRSGAFLDARDHLLQDATAEAKFGFNLQHAWEAAQQGLLLDSTAVFLSPGILKLQMPPCNRLTLLHQVPERGACTCGEMTIVVYICHGVSILSILMLV